MSHGRPDSTSWEDDHPGFWQPMMKNLNRELNNQFGDQVPRNPSNVHPLSPEAPISATSHHGSQKPCEGTDHRTSTTVSFWTDTGADM